MPIVRRTDCVPLPMVVCPVVAVAMLESRVARCVHCVSICPCAHLEGVLNSEDAAPRMLHCGITRI